MADCIQAVVVNSHGVGQVVHVKKLPVQGETIRGWGWRVEQDGGKGSNAAIALGRLGIRAAYVGKVGEDPWGDLGALWMSEAGVDIRCMYRSPDISTGTGLIMLDEEGQNTIVLGGSSGRALTEDEIVQGVRSFPEAQVLLTGFEIPEKLSLLAARTGKEMGMFTIVNPSPLPEDELFGLDYVDILLLNEVEAKGLIGEDPKGIRDRELLEMLYDRMGAQGIIMTLGERGALGLDGSGFWEIPGIAVSAVDSTGAGDGFGAALAAGLIEGKTIREASHWACAYAAYTVQHMGTIPSYPHRDELEEFMVKLGVPMAHTNIQKKENRGDDQMKKENRSLAIELRHDLHRHPEVSNHETWTKARLIRFLQEHTDLEIVDRGRWFYAIYHAGEGKKNIAFRADFDALPMEEGIELPYASENPGVSHKCGHDGHVASLAGFALEIDQQGADKNMYFLFQHAEETGDGAAECKVFIKEHNIDEIFAYHNLTGAPQGSISVIDGTAHWASTGMTVSMVGSPAHASEPEKGVNPAYAIAKIINAIPEMIAPENNDGPVLCTIIQVDIGERAFGISASEGKLLMTIRAHYQKDMDKLRDNIETLAKQLAAEEGIKVEFTYNDTFPDTVNDPASSNKVRRAAKDLGFTLLEREQPRRGSEDFGWFLKETQGAIFYIGNGEDYAQIHTYQYDFCDDNIEVAVEMFKALAAM